MFDFETNFSTTFDDSVKWDKQIVYDISKFLSLHLWSNIKIFCYKSCLQNLRNIFILINILLPTIKATFFISHQNYFWLCFKICISIARWHLVHKINCLFILEKKEHTRISKYDVVQLIIHCWKKKFRHGDMRSYIKIFRSSICFIFGTYVCFRQQLSSTFWTWFQREC